MSIRYPLLTYSTERAITSFLPIDSGFPVIAKPSSFPYMYGCVMVTTGFYQRCVGEDFPDWSWRACLRGRLSSCGTSPEIYRRLQRRAVLKPSRPKTPRARNLCPLVGGAN